MSQRHMEKVLKEGPVHDITTQKRIHRLLSRVIAENYCSLFHVPELIEPESDIYIVKVFDVSKKITIGMLSQYHNYKDYLREYLQVWRRMWYYGFALYDFNLYLQDDGTLVMSDFDHTGFRMTDGPRLCSFPKPFNEEYLFDHSCYPQYFLEKVMDRYWPITPRASIHILSQYPYRENVGTRNPA